MKLLKAVYFSLPIPINFGVILYTFLNGELALGALNSVGFLVTYGYFLGYGQIYLSRSFRNKVWFIPLSIIALWMMTLIVQQPAFLKTLNLTTFLLQIGGSWYYLNVKARRHLNMNQVSRLEEMELVDETGQAQSLSQLTQEPAFFVFHRGVWCQYCRQQIQAIRSEIDEFKRRNLPIYLVSNDSFDRLSKFSKKSDPYFKYVVDPELKLGDYLGIKMDDAGASFYNRNQDQVFTPTNLLTGKGGEIIYIEATDNHTERVDHKKALFHYDEHLIQDRLNSEIELKTSEITELYKVNKSLMRSLIHDISNTQQILLGSAQIGISRYGTEEKLNRLFTRMQTAVKMQINIVKKVRDLESIRANKRVKTLEVTTISEIFQEISFLFLERYETKGLYLEFSHDEDYSLVTDKDILVNQVLGNLISNSYKFTEKGGKVTVHASQSDDHISFSVKDTGLGIPEEKLHSLFSYDKATSSEGTQGEKGTGFGMPIVKEYVHFLNGEISIESTQGENSGTVIDLHFPIENVFKKELKQAA